MDSSPNQRRNNNSEAAQHSHLGTSTPISACSMDQVGEHYSEEQLQQVLNEIVDMNGEQLDSFLGNEAGYIPGSFGDQDLGRMFLAYKQLDARVSRLEAHVFPPQQPKPRMSKRQYSSMSVTTSLTSSPGDSSTSTIDPSIFDRSMTMMSDLKDLRRTELDTYCLPLLQVNPKPEKDELQTIARHLEPFYPQFRHKDLLSKIREWFRKRREYMSQRIFNICEQVFPASTMTSDVRLRECIAEINQDHSRVLMKIIHESQLEITDEKAAMDYCREKIVSHLTNAYREYVKIKTALS